MKSRRFFRADSGFIRALLVGAFVECLGGKRGDVFFL